MRNGARKILALTCAFVLILGVSASAAALELNDGYYSYTFYAADSSGAFTNFEYSVSASLPYDPLYIKVNLAFPEVIEAGTYFDLDLSFYAGSAGAYVPIQMQLCGSSWNTLQSSDEFTLTPGSNNLLTLSVREFESVGECKYISFVFRVDRPSWGYGMSFDHIYHFYATDADFKELSTLNFFERLWLGITNLPSRILSGLKDLVVPSEQDLIEIRDKWLSLAKDRFGAAYEAADIILNFVSEIKYEGSTGSLEFPEYEFDLKVCKWKFGGWTVDLVPDGFDPVIVVLKLISNIVCTFLFVTALKTRFENLLGGHKE